MRTNPEKYQAMVLSRTEDKLLLQSGKIDIRTAEKTNLLGVVRGSKLEFDDQVSSICCKVSAQINALNRLKNILPLKTKECYIVRSYYRIFITATKFGTIAEKETLHNSKKSMKER